MESGALYLGRRLDPSTAEPTDDRADVASHSLTTHGVIVGMTGSGKTGLGVVLLEEALAGGVPALILDPKGDMGNLALNFPDLRPSDFRPWVDEGEARREGVTPDALAESTAATWREGLARSGLGPEQMAALKRGVDVRILTPGSTAGLPLNLLGDLRAPARWDDHDEAVREEIEGLVSGLLVLADLEADPLTSREHILLSNLVEHAWRDGRDLDLATLVGQIPSPPIRRLGVFELDAFFPPADRMKLAMRLNGLIASPSFADWLVGEPLDVGALFRAPDGRPRASILYLSHLADRERQFVVTLILSKLVTWMRRQAGTSDLRALLYIDEIFGFAPPTGEPPSKRPLLTLFKQARAHGLGVVVATQNPMDLDYKLMSNAGTWMVGRLQTERDKARILEALQSASGSVDVGRWDARLGALGKRQFLLKTAGSDQPALFTTRWAMSYLRGPLTRTELGRLEQAAPPAAGPPAAGGAGSRGSAAAPGSGEPALADDETPVAPAVAAGVPVRYLDPAAPWARELGVAPGSRLEAGVAVRVHLLFDETRADLRHEEEWEAVIFPVDAGSRADDAVPVDHDPRDFRDEAPDGVRYALTDAPIDRSSFFKDLQQDVEEALYRDRAVTVAHNPALKLFARVGEDDDAFARRCLEAAEKEADDEAAKLRKRYESKLDTVRRRMEDSERRLRELEVDLGQRKTQEMVAGAGELLSLFMGGRRRTRSLSGVASRRSQTVRTGERLRSAEDKLAQQQDAMADLEQELAEELEEIWARWRATAEAVESMEVRLEKNDIRVDDLILFWAPTGD